MALFGFGRKPKPPADAPAAPTEFVPQTLEPTGGTIPRPRDWFYQEKHQGQRMMWSISKEDPGLGPYVTGMSVQLLRNRQAVAGTTAEDFVRGFAEHKKRTSGKVVRTFDEAAAGPFRRIGVETLEGDFRIRYSLFWLSDGGDLAAIVTAGARPDLWDVYEPTFDTMGDFQLIDMSRSGK